jgi:hypothetical protein
MTLAEHHELPGAGVTDRNTSWSDVASRYSALTPLSNESLESITKLLKGLPTSSAIMFCVDQLGALWPRDFADATDDYTRMQRVAECCHCSFHINEKTRTATFTKIPLSENALRGIVRVSQVPAMTNLNRSVITVNRRPSSHFASLVVVAIAFCGAATAAVLWRAASPGESATSVVAFVASEKLALADSPPQSDSTGHGQAEIRVTTLGATSLSNDAQRSLGEVRAPDRFHRVDAGKDPAAGKAEGGQSQTVAKRQLAARSSRTSAKNSPDALLFRPWWYSWR